MARDLFQEAGIAPNPPAGRLVYDDESPSKQQAKPWEHDWRNDPVAETLPDWLVPVNSQNEALPDWLVPVSNEAETHSTKPPRVRTWGEAAGDTAIDLAKGVVGLGESVVGVTDLATGNMAGNGWSELGFDPARTKQILSELYSDSRKSANKKVADAEGFADTTMALLSNPSAAIGSVAESAPLMLVGAGAVRLAATKMLAASGLVAGSAEAAAYLANPAVVARLTAIGSAAEGATTSGNVQEQGRQAGRSWSDTAPSALAAGAVTGAIGFGTSKLIPDAEVGAALAGMGGKRQGLIDAGKQIAQGTFKEGVLEELPQSAQEQVFTNLATGKPWDEGVSEAAAQGMVAGAGMGGGMTTYSAGRNALTGSPKDGTNTPPALTQQALIATDNEATSTTQRQPATARPEVRLAELELLSEQRSLTDAEKSEGQSLAGAMHDDSNLNDLAEAGSAENSAHPPQTDRLPKIGETVPKFEDVPDFEASAPAAPAPATPRPYWEGFQTGDRVKTPHGTTGTLVIGDDKHLAYLVHDKNADGSPNTDGGMFSVTPQEVAKIQQPAPAAPVAEYKAPTDFWTFAREKGAAPGLKVGSPEWQTLKNEFEMAKAGLTPENPAYAPAPQPAPRMELQNRDRSRAASVMQMQDIAKNPDYMRLGTSRTPDSGAPMIFPVGDDGRNIPDTSLGHEDMAVMSDGARVPFVYAVVTANQVNASNFSDGNLNPAYDSKEPGTLKALNNGRTAGLQSAYMRGKAEKYKAELLADVANHGVPAEVINRTVNPMLVRLYRDADNTPDMGAKSQGQGLSMAPGELAKQDAPLLDATILTAYRPGDVTSAANRDFVRAFIGKLRHHGQDTAALMTADGTLSPAGRTRIQAALVQAAYGDGDLVDEMFDSQDNAIKGIGTALKTVAGQLADMRDSARMGAIDASVDITGNLVAAVNLIRKSRQEMISLNDLANQRDLLTGATPDPLTVGLLHFFYRGDMFLSLPLSSEKVTAKLNAYVQAAMSVSGSVGMFDDAVTVDRILESINNGDNHASTQTPDLLTSASSSGDRGLDPDTGRAGRPGSGGSQGGTDTGGTGTAGRERTASQGVQEGDQGDAATQAGTGQRRERDTASVSKITDAGQKIGGARKDRWKERGLDLSDLEGMSESEGAELATKSNVWKPDYTGMVQGGTRADTAAFIKVVYDSLAAKPKKNTPEGRRQYVTMMQHVRSLYTELAQLDTIGNKVPRRAMLDAAELLKVRLGLRSQDTAAVKAGKELLFSVYKGRSDPFVVSINEEQRARKLVADGFPNAAEPWKSRLIVGEYGGSGLTARGVELIVKEAEALGTPVTAEQVQAGVYRVVTKPGKALAYLPTRADAEAAAKTIYAGKLKAAANDKAEPTRPHLDTLKRDNLPQRIDRDVTADDFVKDFGFRGVEFGNWAAQDERQRILNMAYDGLRDLAEIMGVPPKALSLNGSLGMAFGARGGGKFAAHYEPGKLVINMTKLQDGGSMAHEWAHGMDHYMGELNRPDAYTTAARGASGWYSEEQYKGVPVKRMEQVGKEWKTVEKTRLDNLRPELARAFDRVMSTLFSGQETKAQMIRSLELQLERTQALAAKETDPQTKAMYERMVKSQTINLEESRQEPDGKTYPKGRSEYAANAQKLSGKSANGYWSRPTEMFARAFESWVFDKVAAMGARSDYLVHGVEEDRFAGGQYKGNPYPTGTERAMINAALDNLVKTIQTKETDKGVAMFSRGTTGKSMPASTVQQVVDQVTSKWTNAPDVVVLASMDDAPAAVRKEYERQNSKGATGSTEGFFYGGNVYLVADQLATPTDTMRVLFHEALGHMGLRGAFGDSLKPILQQIILARRAEVAAKAQQYGLDMSKPEDALTAAEEVLAEMAQTKPEMGFVKRAIAAIRTWLRANVPGFKDLELTDADIIASYILPARAFVHGGKAVMPDGEAAFSRNTIGGSQPPQIQPGQQNPWTRAKAKVMKLTSPEAIEKLIYEFQDKYIDLKNLRAHIQELGGTITDLNDAYLGEELYHSRLAKRNADFLDKELKPLLADMRSRGVSMVEFESYLHARHAPEANAAMAERNPTRQMIDDGRAKSTKDVKDLELKLQHARNNHSATKAIEEALTLAREELAKWHGAQAYKGSEEARTSLSGMSDDDAKAYMDSLTPRKRENLDELATRVDAIQAETLDTLERYGLMDHASLTAWRKAYEFYVPLHRDEARPETGSHPVGQGFSVKGNAAKQRTGSTEKVTNILAHIAMQREAALTRGEKNHVVKKLYLMAAQNPDKDYWEVDAPPMIKSIDSRTGFVRTMVDPQFKHLDNVVMVRIAGNDQAIVFNEHNKQAKRLAEAVKNIDVGDLHVVLGLAAKGTRWFASVNTQFNPIFGLVNFARDVQSGLLNLSTTELAGKQKEVAANIPAAMRAIYRERRGKSATSVAWTRLWDEYQSVGGITGYKDMFADVDERTKALTKELQALDRGEVAKAAHAVLDWLDSYNTAAENSVRLAAYKQALDQGMSKERAASLAKNLTVNFNRKGRQAREIGALYAFFNASIQGTSRMADTLKGPVGKRIMYGGVLLGVVNTLIGMAVMGGDDDDDWERVPEFIKERSIVIPISGKDYLTIPMPLGFHVFPNIGRIATEFALGGQDKTAGRQLGKLLMAMVDSFNPIGGSQNLGQMVSPTVIDPVVALMENRDWTGRPIYRENTNGLDPQPGHMMAKDSASSPSRLIAEAVNSITGGTQYRPGAWSPTPDQLDYIIGQLTGGLGRELLKVNQTIVSTATGDELPPYKVPLLGRVYGNTSGPSAHSEQFYANVKTLNEIENEIKGRLIHSEDVDGYRKSEPLADLVGTGNMSERQISKIRKIRRVLVERSEPGYQERIKELDKQIGDIMANLNKEVAKARKKGNDHE